MEVTEYYKHIQEMEEWQAYYYYTSLHFRLRKIIRQANWNKNVITRFELNNNDKEIHRHRFDRLLEELEEVDKNWKELRYNYDSNRINKIKQQLTKIKNYEHKTNSTKVQPK
jgi:hypothetical protein